MPYTAAKPTRAPSSEELRARIPGWGADLDPKDRPSVPQHQAPDGLVAPHWEFPDRQPETWPRERSVEHLQLPPVFGTSCPPKGLSGVLRKLAYRRYSEARAAHWLILVAADRVDAAESHLRSLLTRRPDNPITQTGIRSELTHHGASSRLGHKRADVGHHLLDPVLVAGPWLAVGGAAYAGIRALLRGRRG